LTRLLFWKILNGDLMEKWKVLFSKQALKDLELLKNAGLDSKAKALVILLEENPLHSPPPYEKLVGDLMGFYSRRINIQHRIVYSVHYEAHYVKILRMWSHYER
jgi:toxin YoeB